MNNKTVLGILIFINIGLAIIFVSLIPGMIENLNFEYVEGKTLQPENLRSYLEWEKYGVVASLGRVSRGGAQPSEEYVEYYRLGEYADRLFMKEVFAASGNDDTAKEFEDRNTEIRAEMPEYDVIFDKIDQSVESAVKE